MTSERKKNGSLGKEPNDELLALAQQFDQKPKANPPDEGHNVDEKFNADKNFNTDGQLSDAQQQELARIQDALGFLNAVKSDIDFLEHEALLDTPQAGETLNHDAGTTTRTLPARIGRFRIEDLLGQGGYAKVFLAYDPNLDRKVAIKVPKASNAFSSDARARFEREAKAAAVLSHPNIIPVFETGTVDTDQFIVSEYCQGINLEDWFQQQDDQVDAKVAATIVATVADAVAHAHQRGIMHRDLKLANLMLDQSELRLDSQAVLTEDMFLDRVRVTDFGLAKPMQGSDILETTEGAIVGLSLIHISEPTRPY